MMTFVDRVDLQITENNFIYIIILQPLRLVSVGNLIFPQDFFDFTSERQKGEIISVVLKIHYNSYSKKILFLLFYSQSSQL